jgi:hypothetical protein
MPVQPSVKALAEFRGAALALKAAPREIRNDINRTVRAEGNAWWKEAIAARASSKMDRLVLVKGARIQPGNPARAVAASSRRPLADGLVPDTDARAWEFGTTEPQHQDTYTRKAPRTGQRHQVTRHVKRQLPRATNRGRVVYPAWSDVAPRLVAMWVQIIVRKIYESIDRK